MEQKAGPDRRLGREARDGSTSCRRRQVAGTLTHNYSKPLSIPSLFNSPPILSCNSPSNQPNYLRNHFNQPTNFGHSLRIAPYFIEPGFGEEPFRNRRHRPIPASRLDRPFTWSAFLGWVSARLRYGPRMSGLWQVDVVQLQRLSSRTSGF